MKSRIFLPVFVACALVASLALLAGTSSSERAAGDDTSQFTNTQRAQTSACPETSSGYGSAHGWDDEGNDENDDDEGDDGRKICVCHVPKGNPDNAHTICVGVPSLCVHLGHGDELGPCAEPCGGVDGVPCEEGQFCKRPLGECADDAEGECVDSPDVCPTIYAPVCGCDERTYSNACYADVAGVAVESDGECDPVVACGGSHGDTCDATQYCKRKAGECGDDGEGVCADLPPGCPNIFQPVCGCDEMTYDNACLAIVAGTNVASAGECDSTQACGGSTGMTCDDDEFCKRPMGECGDDAEGECADIPGACPGVILPVCGCDGKTYDNACLAYALGVTVASSGPCKNEQVCGGSADLRCGAGMFCLRPEGECKAEGVCTETPDMCPTVLDPVCGCDGMRYGNACIAYAADTTVSEPGSCQAPKSRRVGPQQYRRR